MDPLKSITNNILAEFDRASNNSNKVNLNQKVPEEPPTTKIQPSTYNFKHIHQTKPDSAVEINSQLESKTSAIQK
jgi:hypothetical protein